MIKFFLDEQKDILKYVDDIEWMFHKNNNEIKLIIQGHLNIDGSELLGLSKCSIIYITLIEITGINDIVLLYNKYSHFIDDIETFEKALYEFM